MDIDQLDKKLWKQMKKNAGIKSSKWFKKADASVGKYIEACNKARQKFVRTQLTEDLLDYQKALDKLNDAFDKFIDAKHLDEIDEGDIKETEKKGFKSDIDDWKKDISNHKSDLDKKLKKLVKATGGDIKKIEQLDAKKKKAVWDQTGISDTFNI